MTGGELVNGKREGKMTGTYGESIRGEMSHVLKPGDVMFVPAVVPHGFVATKDRVTFVTFKTRYTLRHNVRRPVLVHERDIPSRKCLC